MRRRDASHCSRQCDCAPRTLPPCPSPHPTRTCARPASSRCSHRGNLVPRPRTIRVKCRSCPHRSGHRPAAAVSGLTWQSESMDLNSYLAVIRPETALLAATADEAGLHAQVPTTPGWTMSDLVLHIGEVHRWATAAVACKATKLSQVPGDFLGEWPEPAAATTWLRRGADALCDALGSADMAIDYATFLANPPT